MTDIRSAHRRNYASMIIEGIFFFTGYTFFDVYVVIPVFLDTVTGDIRLAGLAAAIKLFLFALPQFIMGEHARKIKRVPVFLGIVGLLGRASFFILPVMIRTEQSKTVIIISLFTALVISSFAEGLTHVPWLNMLAGTILPAKRSKLLGYQMFFGGAGSLAAGLYIKRTLNFTDNVQQAYGNVFFAGAVLLSVSGAMLFTLRSAKGSFLPAESHEPGVFRKLRIYIKSNESYRNLLLTQGLAASNGLAAPLYILFAKHQFDLSDSNVTILMFTQIAGTLLAGIFWGYAGHIKGTVFSVKTGIIINIAVASAAIFSGFLDTATPLLFFMPVVLMAGLLTGSFIGYTNRLFEVAPEIDRTRYIAVTSIALFPFTLVPLAGGLAAGAFGYVPVFCAVLFFQIAALVSASRL